jgi:hypothetical protein
VVPKRSLDSLGSNAVVGHYCRDIARHPGIGLELPEIADMSYPAFTFCAARKCFTPGMTTSRAKRVFRAFRFLCPALKAYSEDYGDHARSNEPLVGGVITRFCE